MFNTIAGIASVIGLGVSIWTLIVATGAKKAAGQAREAVRKGDAAEDLKNLSTIAKEFLSHIEADQSQTAVLRARDLMSATSLASRRWGRFLSVEARNNLEEAYGQMERHLAVTIREWCTDKSAAER